MYKFFHICNILYYTEEKVDMVCLVLYINILGSGYIRNCYKHSNSKTLPKTLHNLPQEEMEKWIRELI